MTENTDTTSITTVKKNPKEYIPSIDDNGNYIDNIPADCYFADGMICNCNGNIFYSKKSFSTHTTTKIHCNYLNNMNKNKNNFLAKSKELEELTKEQKLIICDLQKKLKQTETQLNQNKCVIEYYEKKISELLNQQQFPNQISFLNKYSFDNINNSNDDSDRMIID